ncbi:MAG: hypothetical protein GX876_01620 [Bacteroidales bacterium]|nr:hypothetical protein [Bacteroidales bacterium]
MKPNQTNLKEKGRGFSLSSELCALRQQPLPGPFLNRKGFAYAKIKILRDYGCGL